MNILEIKGSGSCIGSGVSRPITYPARPINGGPLPKAPPKSGLWYYEPKVNGWRTLVHVPTGAMFNRKNQRLSIESEFSTSLKLLRERFPAYEWLDCEALERRHGIGRGSLIVLDIVIAGKTYRERFDLISDTLGYANCIGSGITVPAANGIYRLPHWENHRDFGLQVWQELQDANKTLGVPFYEGLVAKRADSLYPFQLRSPDLEFPFWTKHRWAF
ncbi:MAG TPA: hypothetical protein VMO20_09760 [Candidatus Acidoferrum sp.]|nr:hypothetical protein [Candidatus Acidoferrum sp.]